MGPVVDDDEVFFVRKLDELFSRARGHHRSGRVVEVRHEKCHSDTARSACRLERDQIRPFRADRKQVQASAPIARQGR